MRRRHLQNGWNGRCKYAKMLSQPSQAFHSTILSHWAQAAPVNSSEAYVWKFNEENNKFHSQSDFYKEKSVEPVNYEHQKSGEKISNEAKVSRFSSMPVLYLTRKLSLTTQAIAPKTFDDAVQNLLHVLGDIEFQLGVASVQSDRYDLAVSHFKLATSHSHASAAFNLGICYEEGIGIEKNAKMALECYMLASSLGHAKASYNVGVFHARGLADLPKNRKAARQYFQEAAKLGLNKANKVLGRQSIAPLETVEQKIVPKVTNYQYEPIAVAV